MKQDSLIKKNKISVKEAKKVLEESGLYRIEKIKTSSMSISYSDLIEFFYSQLEKREGTEFILSVVYNKEKDFSTIKNFIKKAKEVGWNKAKALDSLHSMLKLVFTYYDFLELKHPPASLSFLLSSSGNWIIQKAIILDKNKNKNYENSKEFQEYVDSLCSIKTKEVEKYEKIRHNILKKIHKTIKD